jgi:hypothetical protein
MSNMREDALEYHRRGRPGKIEVVPTKPVATQRDLSLAYTPGVAQPVLEIERDPQTAYDYTANGSLVAVVTNGTAILGLGDGGAPDVPTPPAIASCPDTVRSRPRCQINARSIVTEPHATHGCPPPSSNSCQIHPNVYNTLCRRGNLHERGSPVVWSSTRRALQRDALTHRAGVVHQRSLGPRRPP